MKHNVLLLVSRIKLRCKLIQIFLIGIVLYIVLYILAKLRVSTGLTKSFPIINGLLVTLLIIIVVLKTGLIRIFAMFLGSIITMVKDLISSFF
ncbi:hypothetical protein UACE39S_05279 [Ureibacillus acetophenoni]